MDEIVKYGDRKVKTSESQAGKLRSFFVKVKNNVVRHFLEGVTFKQLRNERLYYKLLKNKISELQENLNVLKEKFDKAEDKNALLEEYNNLNKKLEELLPIITADVTKVNVVYNLPNEKIQELRNKYDEAKNQFDQFENYFKSSYKTKNKSSKNTNSFSIEPIKIDRNLLKNNNSIEPKRFKPGELTAAKDKKNNNLAADNKNKDIKEKFDLTDLTIFKSYAEYKKAYFWNKYINEVDSAALEKMSSVLAKTADTTNNEFKGLLNEVEYSKTRDKQVKDKEIFEIKASHEKEISSLNEAKKKAVDDTKKEFNEKINSLSEELDTAKSDIKKLKNIIKIQMKAIDKASEISKTIGGIPAIDEAITACKTRCDSINEKSAVSDNSKEGNDELENTAIAYAEAVKNQGKHFKQEMPKGNDDLENTTIAYAEAVKNQGKQFKQEMPKGNDGLENAAVAYVNAIKEQEISKLEENSKEANDELENVAKEQEQSQPAMSKIVTADATEVAKEQKSTRLGRVAAATDAIRKQENATKLSESTILANAIAMATESEQKNAPETKTEKSDKKSENSNVNASETPTKDSLEVSNISMQQVPQVSDDDVKESNELINELSIIDRGLDDYSGMLSYVNQSDALSNEQNPENKPARVR